MLTAEQLRAARAILRIEQTSVAQKAGVSVETIKRLEAQDGPLQAHFATLSSIKQALELEGIVFLDNSENGGPGVRAMDRNAVLVAQITHHFTQLIGGVLAACVERDPAFLTRTDSTEKLKKIAILAASFVPDILKGKEPSSVIQSICQRVPNDPLAELAKLIASRVPIGRTRDPKKADKEK